MSERSRPLKVKELYSIGREVDDLPCLWMTNSVSVTTQNLDRMSFPKIKNKDGTLTMMMLCLIKASPNCRVTCTKPRIGIGWADAECSLTSLVG